MKNRRRQSYDLSSSSFRASPFDTYAAMRAETPVMQLRGNQGNVWFVTGYEEAKIVLADNKRFVKEYQNTLPEDQRDTASTTTGIFDLLYNNMAMMDPPDHTRLRTIVSKAFTHRHILELAPRIQEIADTLIDEFPASGHIDLIERYAFPLPIIVITEILGIPTADRDKFRTWSNAFVEGAAGGMYVQYMMDFVSYIRNIVAERRVKPQDDLVSALIKAEEAGDRLTEQELFSMITLLIVAGHETTVNLIANGTLALLQHPDQLRQLQQYPDLTEGAIEEFLRYNGAVDHTSARYAAEDVELGGQRIPRGSTIIISLVAANRDPRQFDQPDRFDIRRENNKHLDFGYGIHYCLGAPLARLEGKIAVNTLLQRVPDLQLVVPARSLRYRQSTFVRGVAELPVRYPQVIPAEERLVFL